jgi:hypothetical protein
LEQNPTTLFRNWLNIQGAAWLDSVICQLDPYAALEVDGSNHIWFFSDFLFSEK